MSVLTLADAKTHLNITGSASDTELQTFIDAAEGVIAKQCGPLTLTVRTDRVSGGSEGLVLPVTPVVSITSITPVLGTALTLSDLYVNTTTGIVEYTYGSSFWAREYDVTYTAGRATVPADLLMAVKEMTRHLWQSQRGSGARPGSTASASTPGFLIPNLVAELLTPYRQAGVA